jgi:archaeosine synthase beta-subunit
MSLEAHVERLYRDFGPSKNMGDAAQDTRHPHYFLHRNFLGEQDLLIIFNSKRCRYHCSFCDLPLKSTSAWVPSDDILAQFEYVISELRHSLSVIDRLTLSNEGSVLDETTFPFEALEEIAKCARQLKNVRTIVIETRLEFLEPRIISRLKQADPKSIINILAGFETLNQHIRDQILIKGATLDDFLAGLDKVAESQSELTAFVLYKPSFAMTDQEAFREAEASIDYVRRECDLRNIPLTVRLNPMYAAHRSKWAGQAFASSDFKPPRITDVLALAMKKREQGIPVYIGLSTEGLTSLQGSYMAREDYSKEVLKKAIVFNHQKVLRR